MTGFESAAGTANPAPSGPGPKPHAGASRLRHATSGGKLTGRISAELGAIRRHCCRSTEHIADCASQRFPAKDFHLPFRALDPGHGAQRVRHNALVAVPVPLDRTGPAKIFPPAYRADSTDPKPGALRLSFHGAPPQHLFHVPASSPLTIASTVPPRSSTPLTEQASVRDHARRRNWRAMNRIALSRLVHCLDLALAEGLRAADLGNASTRLHVRQQNSEL